MGWLGAAGAALALNLVFFAAMPCLLQPAPSKPAFEDIISQVNVIRLHRTGRIPPSSEKRRSHPSRRPSANSPSLPSTGLFGPRSACHLR
jgi:hypothetical protein